MKKKSLSVAVLGCVLGGCGSGGDSDAVVVPEVKPVVENASICFNKNLYTAGAESNLIYREDDLSERTEHQKIIGDAEYRGQSATQIDNGAVGDLFPGYTYSIIDNDEKSISELGFRDGSFERHYEPAQVLRFNLNKGESYEQTISNISVGFPDAVSNMHVTFKGLETITVPAGTYKTCKFEVKASATNGLGLTTDSTFSSWFAVESGIVVQTADEYFTSKLTEATINGTKI